MSPMAALEREIKKCEDFSVKLYDAINFAKHINSLLNTMLNTDSRSKSSISDINKAIKKIKQLKRKLAEIPDFYDKPDSDAVFICRGIREKFNQLAADKQLCLHTYHNSMFDRQLVNNLSISIPEHEKECYFTVVDFSNNFPTIFHIHILDIKYVSLN